MQNEGSNCKLVNTKLRRASFPPLTSFHLMRCHLSPPRLVEFNLDGSLINSSAVGGFILRDWTSRVLKAGLAHSGATMILVAKARAPWDGLYVAIQVGYRQLIVEGDNKIVIQTLQGNIQIIGQIH